MSNSKKCMFIKMCFYKNNLDDLKYYNKKHRKHKKYIGISANNECAFAFTFQIGHLNVAKWLLEIKPDINITVCEQFTTTNDAFIYACVNNAKFILKFILQYKFLKYNIFDEKLCYVKNKLILKWII